MMDDKINVNPTTDNEVRIPLTDEELNDIFGRAEDSAKNNNDIVHLRDIQKEEHDEEGLVEGTAKFYVGPNGQIDVSKPLSSGQAGDIKEADLAIDEIDQLEERNAKILVDNANHTAETLGLTEDEAINIAQILLQYKSAHNKTSFPVYNQMIPSMKERVRKMCMENGIPLTDVHMVARLMMDQFISTASEDEEFIDIEKTIERTMKIPSMVDIYMEHVNDTMDIRLPAMADAIREKDPEKADTLMKIKDRYTNAFLFNKLREMYDNNSRLRKLVRRECDENSVMKYARQVNYFNSATKFKMPDCTTIPEIVRNIIGYCGFDKNDPVNIIMVNKFCILLFGAASYLDLENDLLDAAFYYYSIKNIAMMAYLSDKLSDFSAELISNINITINFIGLREAELSANTAKSDSNKNNRKKSHKHS